MQVIKAASQMTNLCRQLRQKKKTIAFVPTMGALHEGHLSLMREARKQADVVVVSIFVNPRQFNDPQDFKKYARDLEGDLKKCQQMRADIIFAPSEEEIYPPGKPLPKIPLPDVARRLEGMARPGHFEGVVTVVHRLFTIINPNTALFGMKDYQQIRVLEEMVQEQKMAITIVRHPTVREEDGLAMSSRNVRLSRWGRRTALALSQSLMTAERIFQSGEIRGRVIRKAVQEILKKEIKLTIDYVSVVDAETLEDIGLIDRPALVAIAAFVEEVRLIDNGLLDPSEIRTAA